jgi:hypothetical protein
MLGSERQLPATESIGNDKLNAGTLSTEVTDTLVRASVEPRATSHR